MASKQKHNSRTLKEKLKLKLKGLFNYYLNLVSAKQSSVAGKISIPRLRSFARLQVTKLFKRGKQGHCPRMKNQATPFFCGLHRNDRKASFSPVF